MDLALQYFPTMKRSRINPVSTKRKAQNANYMRLKRKFLDEHPICARCLTQMAVDIHHMAHREGDWLCLFRYVIGICGLCHSSVHRWPAHNKRFFILITDDYKTHVAKLTEQGIDLMKPSFYESNVEFPKPTRN